MTGCLSLLEGIQIVVWDLFSIFKMCNFMVMLMYSYCYFRSVYSIFLVLTGALLLA